MALAVDADTYDAWYRTPRGSWIGDVEYRLLHRMLAPPPGESLLDVGCGTAYFTRRFARDAHLRVTGLDPDREWLAYARAHGSPDETYIAGDARDLPFRDASFDFVVSVTALCFIQDERRALQQLMRVARKRITLGLLNRHSLLYRQKGRGGGTGAYHGAHWHTVAEVKALFADSAVTQLTLRSAVFIPSGNRLALLCERCLPDRLPWGGFLVAAANVSPSVGVRRRDCGRSETGSTFRRPSSMR